MVDRAYENHINHEDKIVEAIDRLEMTLRILLTAILSCLVWIALSAAFSLPAFSAPLIPPLTEPAPLQYWHTVDIPRDSGVYPLEVFAPALPALIHQPVIVEIGDPPAPPVHVPEPATGWLVSIPLVLIVVIVVGWGRNEPVSRRAFTTGYNAGLAIRRAPTQDNLPGRRLMIS